MKTKATTAQLETKGEQRFEWLVNFLICRFKFVPPDSGDNEQDSRLPDRNDGSLGHDGGALQTGVEP